MGWLRRKNPSINMSSILLALQSMLLFAAVRGTDASPLLSQASQGASVGNKAEVMHSEIAQGASLLETTEGQAKLRSWLNTLQSHKQRRQNYQDNMATINRNPSMQESAMNFLREQENIGSEKSQQKPWDPACPDCASASLLRSHQEQQGGPKSQGGSVFQSERQPNKIKSKPVPKGTKPKYGSTVPRPFDHWRWNGKMGQIMFNSNDGLSQARLDKPGTVKIGLRSDKNMIDAVNSVESKTFNAKYDSVNNERDLYDTQYYGIGGWEWKKNEQVSRMHKIPQWRRNKGDGVSGITKFFHEQWSKPDSHLKSAYEPDFFTDNSEYFGPFKIEYGPQTIKLQDWNLKIDTDRELADGRGNMVVGPHHFFTFAKNSFIAGKHNNARGDAQAIWGGDSNMVTGRANSVTGGQGNLAEGWASHVTGGLRNEATANFSSIRGGARNRADGRWSSIAGGSRNQASGEYSTVLGGEANKALGLASSVNGGWGNKAKAQESVIVGGSGGKTDYKYQMLIGKLPGEEEEVAYEQKVMKAMAGAHGGQPNPDGSGAAEAEGNG